MSAPTAEYWRAKASLCRELFIDQVQHGQEREAVRNLFRYSHALTMAELTEEEGERETAHEHMV